jgi:hypothetical protein
MGPQASAPSLAAPTPPTSPTPPKRASPTQARSRSRRAPTPPPGCWRSPVDPCARAAPGRARSGPLALACKCLGWGQLPHSLARPVLAVGRRRGSCPCGPGNGLGPSAPARSPQPFPPVPAPPLIPTRRATIAKPNAVDWPAVWAASPEAAAAAGRVDALVAAGRKAGRQLALGSLYAQGTAVQVGGRYGGGGGCAAVATSVRAWGARRVRVRRPCSRLCRQGPRHSTGRCPDRP